MTQVNEPEDYDDTFDKAIAVSNEPGDIIRTAIAGGADLEKLEKLLALQERWEANEAKKAYHEAMAKFKQNPPKIDKDRTVAYGNTKYNHASLGNVTDKISAELSKHGLSASWTTKQAGTVDVTCKITHIKGHSEETTLSAPADNSGSKNSIQAIGSTITYLERYTLLALTGLATYDQDDDGIASSDQTEVIEFISAKEVNTILDSLVSMDISVDKFCGYMKTPSLEKLAKKDYPKALSALEAAKKKREATK